MGQFENAAIVWRQAGDRPADGLKSFARGELSIRRRGRSGMLPRHFHACSLGPEFGRSEACQTMAVSQGFQPGPKGPGGVESAERLKRTDADLLAQVFRLRGQARESGHDPADAGLHPLVQFGRGTLVRAIEPGAHEIAGRFRRRK